MTYYKIYKNNEIIDVNNQFFFTQKPHGIILECDVKHAELICSSDGQNYYQTQWIARPSVYPEVFEEVYSEKISEEEYNELRAKLDEGVQPIIIHEEHQELKEEPKEKVFSLLEVQSLISQMSEHINKLESELQELRNK